MTSLRAPRITAALSDPAARDWSEAPVASVALGAAPLSRLTSRYVRTTWATRPYGLVRTLNAQAAHDGRSIYLRLEWVSPSRGADAGHDGLVAVEGPDAFPDAVAVMFPQNGGEPELETMGSEEAPVSIWRWGAGVPGGVPETVEDLKATGIGTVGKASGPSSELFGRSLGAGDRWQVVLWRPLEPGEGGEGPPFSPGSIRPMAFSVWVGANQERAGIKSTSAQWINLEIAD